MASASINLLQTNYRDSSSCFGMRTGTSSALNLGNLSAKQEAALDPAKSRLDSLFHTAVKAAYPDGPQSPVQQALESNLSTMGREIAVVDRMFDGNSVKNRVEGARECLAIRKNLAMDLFKKGVRPAIEALMVKHGEHRPFEEIVSIVGFNRLFVRDVASAGTDVDFILFIDSANPDLLADIRSLMKNEVRPELVKIGIDMEAADYLMIDLAKYTSKLNDTRNAFFTLANMNPDNTCFITGSKGIHQRAFSFSDQQLVEHFGNLLFNNGFIEESQVAAFKGALLQKLESGKAPFRRELVSHLQQMASSELYIGKKPYNKKQTIQTIIPKVPAEARQSRTAPFSIKFCINRIADLIKSTRFNPSTTGVPFTKTQVEKLETLGLVLSNIICRQNASLGHPAITLQEGYSDISMEQLENMNASDRKMVAELLASVDAPLDPSPRNFAARCYDALWSLGEQMYGMAGKMERQIYRNALGFASK